MSKVKVCFLQDRVVQDELAGTEDETRFKKGEFYELEPASAEHWISRGVAEVAKAAATTKKAKPADAG